MSLWELYHLLEVLVKLALIYFNIKFFHSIYLTIKVVGTFYGLKPVSEKASFSFFPTQLKKLSEDFVN